MKKISIVQARVGSSRLPGKILKTILGKSILELQIERMALSELKGQIVVATSTKSEDDAIVSLCDQIGIDVFRGSELDLLDRHYQCAIKYQADIIAKIPSDCPLIDPQVIDKVFNFFDSHGYDFVSNLHPASYPDGNDCEVFTISALERAHQNANKQLEREHTTPYFWENPDLFKIENIVWEKNLDYSMSHRFTIDYVEDFEFIKTVYEELYPSNPKFSLEDILNLLERKPEIYLINSNYAGVNWYRNHLDELKTISEANTKRL